jgi:uncharacterized membrane protein
METLNGIIRLLMIMIPAKQYMAWRGFPRATAPGMPHSAKGMAFYCNSPR